MSDAGARRDGCEARGRCAPLGLGVGERKGRKDGGAGIQQREKGPAPPWARAPSLIPSSPSPETPQEGETRRAGKTREENTPQHLDPRLPLPDSPPFSGRSPRLHGRAGEAAVVPPGPLQRLPGAVPQPHLPRGRAGGARQGGEGEDGEARGGAQEDAAAAQGAWLGGDDMGTGDESGGGGWVAPVALFALGSGLSLPLLSFPPPLRRRR